MAQRPETEYFEKVYGHDVSGGLREGLEPKLELPFPTILAICGAKIRNSAN